MKYKIQMVQDGKTKDNARIASSSELQDCTREYAIRHTRALILDLATSVNLYEIDSDDNSILLYSYNSGTDWEFEFVGYRAPKKGEYYDNEDGEKEKAKRDFLGLKKMCFVLAPPEPELESDCFMSYLAAHPIELN